jgi:coenzyme F420-reducing hydrogenase gamma subunit
MEDALKAVYGKDAGNYNTIPARPADAVIKVDYYVRGCPPVTSELVKVIKALLLNKKPDIPGYPVCVECKMAGNICVFEKGQTCLGPVTRAGCSALCVTSGRYCWGCRGLVDEPNIQSQKDVLAKYGLTPEQVIERFKIYDTFSEVAK